MNSKILLSFIAATFLSTGYAVAEVHSSKPKVAEKKPIVPRGRAREKKEKKKRKMTGCPLR